MSRTIPVGQASCLSPTIDAGQDGCLLPFLPQPLRSTLDSILTRPDSSPPILWQVAPLAQIVRNNDNAPRPIFRFAFVHPCPNTSNMRLDQPLPGAEREKRRNSSNCDLV